ncbi:MAG TPA: four helix bundle protein [Myxococcaceae bacterium]|nr:four helix bundle protein [Myxococcaceae bacterium]
MNPFFQRTLRKMGLSVGRLVEDFPPEDEQGLGTRLLSAVSSIPTSTSRAERSHDSTERRRHLGEARGSASEAAYLVGLAQEQGYGRPEQALSAAGRLDSVLAQLNGRRKKRPSEGSR